MKFTNLLASLLFVPTFIFAQSFSVETEVENYLQKIAANYHLVKTIFKTILFIENTRVNKLD